MGDLRLWPEQYEEFRDEARRAVQEFVAQAGKQRASVPPDIASRVRNQRQMMLQRESEQGGIDREIAGVPCRLYKPAGAARGRYVHFHGGGFIAGSAKATEAANVRLSQTLGLEVLSVNYRLAPEHPYPAAIDDGLAVIDWAIRQSDDAGNRLVIVGGESAGAYITVSALLRIRDRGEDARRITGINLVYGGYDFSRCTPAARGRRITSTPDVLTPDETALIADCFLPGLGEEARRMPLVSPVFADLHGMPRALLTVGTADHLFDINLLFAGRWAAAGNQVELAVYPDCSHAFIRLPIELATRAQEKIDSFLASLSWSEPRGAGSPS